MLIVVGIGLTKARNIILAIAPKPRAMLPARGDDWDEDWDEEEDEDEEEN